MKALLLEGKNEWQYMRVGKADMPQPGKGEILVEVHAAGLNPVDYKTATDGNEQWEYPHILGLDVAGTVEKVGEGVTQWKKGDRVLYHGDLTKKGGFAQYAVTTAHTASALPESIPFTEAAALPCAGFTAYQALFRKLHIREGESILIHGGAGGVGGFAVQLAHIAGLKVYTTASRANHEYVRQLGADVAIDYANEDVYSAIMEKTDGRGVDAVLDTISGKNATESAKMLCFNGRIASIAGSPDYEETKKLHKALSYHEVAFGDVHQSGDLKGQRDLATIGTEMLALVKAGKLSPLLEKTIALGEVPEALVQLSKRHVKGKIVAEIKK